MRLKTDYNCGRQNMRNGQEAINLVKARLLPYNTGTAANCFSSLWSTLHKAKLVATGRTFTKPRMRTRDKRQDTEAHEDLLSHTPYITGLISGIFSLLCNLMSDKIFCFFA